MIDADADNRAMYFDALTGAGFIVAAHADPRDALPAAAAADVIVTELRFARVHDGVDAIKALRAQPETAVKPIIVVTASAYPVDIAAAQAAGCDVFLVKPCLPNTLVECIADLLEITRIGS